MRDKVHRRSPGVCRDKWRNLVRKLKSNLNHHRTQHQQQQSHPSLVFFKEATFDPYHFQHDSTQSVPGGLESLNVEMSDRDGQSTTSVMSEDCPSQNGRSAWGWRGDNSANMPQWDSGLGCQPVSTPPHEWHVIVVKWGEMTRRIGIDGSADAIKDAIRSAFGLRSKRSFWLEDDYGVVRSFDRAMPQTTYTLHIDPGVTIKLYHYDECNRQAINSEDATLYSEDDFQELLARNGWQSLREVGTYKDVESIQDLQPMASYHDSGLKGMNL